MAAAVPVDPGVPLQVCPRLYVLAVQGTGESSPQAQPDGADAGMLGAVLSPLRALGWRLAAHAYVPYEAGFGGAVPGGGVPYAESVSGGLDRLRSMAASVIARCPGTELGLLGYSQGAHIVSIFAREIGAGSVVVPADRVAAVALLGDPTRGPAAALFPGAPGRNTPAPAPGTTGAGVSSLHARLLRVAEGEGIGPDRDVSTDFGVLTGRVASLCLPGDLACDAPRMPLLRVLVNIAGQAELNPADPLAALISIARAVQATVARAATDVVDHDLRGSTLGTLSLNPGWSLTQRLADASDPRETSDVRAAVLKIGTSAANSLLALTGRMLTPADVDEVATLAAVDPRAAIALLGEKLVAAGHHRVPRAAVFHLITDIVDAFGQLIDDSGCMLDFGVWSKYLGTVAQHGAYLSAPFTTSGQPAVGFITDWFNAVARDLAIHRTSTTSTKLSSVTPLPTTPIASAPPLPTTPHVVDLPAPPAGASSYLIDLPDQARATARTVAQTDEPGRDVVWVLILAGLAAIAYTARRPRQGPHRRDQDHQTHD